MGPVILLILVWGLTSWSQQVVQEGDQNLNLNSNFNTFVQQFQLGAVPQLNPLDFTGVVDSVKIFDYQDPSSPPDLNNSDVLNTINQVSPPPVKIIKIATPPTTDEPRTHIFLIGPREGEAMMDSCENIAVHAAQVTILKKKVLPDTLPNDAWMSLSTSKAAFIQGSTKNYLIWLKATNQDVLSLNLMCWLI